MSSTTLEEVLSRYGVARRQIDTPCPFQERHEIAGYLTEWEHLAPVIGLTRVDILTIQRNYPGDYRSQCSAALDRWGEIHGSKATFLSLALGLEKKMKIETVEKLCDIFMSRSRDQVDSQHVVATRSPMAISSPSEALKTRVSHFVKRFQRMVVDILKELKMTDESLLEDIQISVTLGLPSVKCDHLAFIEKSIKKISEASNVKELILILNTYWDYNNYTLLEMLVDMYGSDILQQKMADYVSDLQKFWRETYAVDFIAFCKENNYSFKEWQTPPNFAKLKCVVNKPLAECTLHEVENLRRRFSDGLHLQDFALILYELGEGSLVIVWLFDVSLKASCSVALKPGRRNFLHKIDVIELLFVDEDCLYNRKDIIPEKLALWGDDLETSVLMTELREHFEGKFDVQRTFKTKLGQLCHRFMPLIQGQGWAGWLFRTVQPPWMTDMGVMRNLTVA